MLKINQHKKVTLVQQSTLFIPGVPDITPYEKNIVAENEFQRNCNLAILQILIRMGIESLSPNRIEEWQKELRIIPKYSSLFETILKELERTSYIQIVNQKLVIPIHFLEEATRFSLQNEIIRSEENKSSYHNYYKLLFQSIKFFEQVITGRVKATDVLFPDGNSELVSAIYTGDYRANYFNSIVASIIENTIENCKDKDLKIKILEVGGGTGGTTVKVLERLRKYAGRIEYTFTDVSQNFLIEAAQKFEQSISYFETKIFDINRSASKQGIITGTYDIVIGANVIHATTDIAETLKNIKSVLKKKGTLIINELSSLEMFTTLTFGMLAGWWNYKDKELRIPGSPALVYDKWEQVLSEVGFIESEVYPKQKEIPQQIIITKSNGRIVIDNQKEEKKTQPLRQDNDHIVDRQWSKEAENSSKIEQNIIAIAAKTIKLPVTEFRKEKPFTDYGFDSILGLTLIKNINKELGIALDVTIIFNYPTIPLLTNYIVDNYSDVLHKEGKIINKEESCYKSITKTNAGSKSNKIAIIGMSGQFGKASDLEEFWEVLKQGESLIEEVPKDRWDTKIHFDEDPKAVQKTYSKWGSFLRDIDKFDPEFFKISGKEAQNMDPQQRIFLQQCWKALEDAAIDPEALKNSKCGVYVGATDGDYYKTYLDEAKEASTFWGISGSILAARISYYLNLKGAAVAIDTACSSSLVAMDMGCKSLLSQETDIIITGGISLSVTPEFYKLTSMAGMLSPDGQCYTFDQRANGFVPGEGVGVIIMKRLEDATRDGDPIYATIQGILTNQDGATNGITAPSVLSQQDIQKEVFENYRINPETITYVEAHGTGTKLGDPIELQALNTSFKKYTSKVNYCGIGSVKTNIGHTLRAAGVAGVIKILLAMKNRQLPPSINYQNLNQHIELDKSPFIIQDKLTNWDSEIPRRATVSSFGISGTNAFIVLEEYLRKQNASPGSNHPVIIILSALNEERLKDRIQQLIKFIDVENQIELQDIAYTLQVGRKAMECRKAFIVHDKEELTIQLQHFLQQNSLESFQEKNIEIETTEINQALQNKEYITIASYWEQGNMINWLELYDNISVPNKIHLPTYIFAKESYWITPKAKNHSSYTETLHPLIHENISGLESQKFISRLTDHQDIISDHIVENKKILPGVAYIEMVREAVQRSGIHSIHSISAIKWLSPLIFDVKTKNVETEIYRENEDIYIEIKSKLNNKTTIHFEARIEEVEKEIKSIYRDLQTIKKRTVKFYSKQQCYKVFEAKGICYGDTLQRIESANFSREEVLAKITASNKSKYKLPIEVLDNALQTCALLWMQNSDQLALPYAMENISWDDLGDDIKYCYAYHSDHQEGKSFEVELLNATGKVLIRLSAYKMMPYLDTKTNTAKTYLYESFWKPEKVKDNLDNTLVIENHYILIGNTVPEIELEGTINRIEESDETQIFTQVFDEVKRRITSRSPIRFVVVYNSKDQHRVQFLSGMFRTSTIENPKISWKCISVNSGIVKRDDFSKIILDELNQQGTIIKYEDVNRQVKEIRAISPSSIKFQESATIVNDGVYLITGGMGSLGKILIKYFFDKYEGIKIIANGRSALKPNDQEFVRSFKNLTYYRCDITNKLATQQLIDEAYSYYGKLNGIIHLAGIIDDNFIQQKTTQEAKKVFEVKVKGAKNIHETTQHISLDFLVLFSSMSAVLGNSGQADYAAANEYLRDFTQFRNQEVIAKRAFGRTMSIAWPLWDSEGMQMNQVHQHYLEQKLGVLPMPKKEGMFWLEKLLESTIESVVIHYGKAQLPVLTKPKYNEIITKVVEEKTIEIPEITQESLKEATYNYLVDVLAEELHFPKSKFKITDAFEKYGLDSIMMINLTNRLESDFSDLPKTLFFELLTIKELVDFFISEYPKELKSITKFKEINSKENNSKEKIDRQPRISKKETKTIFRKRDNNRQNNDIAIVGLSGRYPKAESIEEFWENLKLGKDCISEIPKDRWQIDGFFDKEKGTLGRSYSKWGGFIDDIDKFDPLFFNITPVEAEKIDPQERLFLQVAWEAVEDAGYTRTTLKTNPNTGEKDGKVGVYVGVMYQEYQLYGIEETLKENPTALRGSASSIANRVSYVFDIHGPSLSLDTMCSSSSTAIHLACKAIQEGAINAAIAGGVNLSVHPNKYLMLCDGGFASSKGKCESFGEGGDGYVPGEGVGAVVLKSFEQAEKDGDHIYGVIKGSALNHGGRTTGYTVPNPKAQASVIREAIKNANVQPESISYVEAHGTGTSLGDPIEIVGLKNALKIPQQQKCYIGSVKSNIGHCESAAGISGITKVLLQLQHKQLVPSIHSSKLNPNIQFDQTSFVVQQKLEPWKCQGEQLRTAGISSFGAGGSNAHIIIEEYPKIIESNDFDKEPVIIVLSAKNKKRLIAYAQKLSFYLDKTKDSLFNIAYTLHIGREAMSERLAIVTTSKEELKQQLTDFIDNQEFSLENIFTANIKNATIDFLLNGKAGVAYIKEAIKQKEFTSIAQLWTKGVDIDWQLIYPYGTVLKKISLPTYPFAKERYWVQIKENKYKQKSNAKLHPLLHTNESDFEVQRYSSVFTGEEYFLTDHLVQNEKLIAGVAYLEMAREAVERSTHKKVTQFREVTWLNPIKVIEESKEISIRLKQINQQVEYQVYSKQHNKEYIHGQGVVTTIPVEIPKAYDLAVIRSRTNQTASSSECYELFKSLGFGYGASFQGIKELYFNDVEALSKIELPKDSEMEMDPGVLDSTLQACLAWLLMTKTEKMPLSIPFSVGEVTVYKEITFPAWSYVRYNNTATVNASIQQCDMDLLNDKGEIVVRFKDFVILPYQEKTFNQKNKKQTLATEFYKYQWEPAEIEKTYTHTRTYDEVILIGASPSLIEQCQSLFKGSLNTINEKDEEVYFLKLLSFIKNRISLKQRGHFTVIINNNNYDSYGFASGLLKSAIKENPRIKTKLISVDELNNKSGNDLFQIIENERTDEQIEVQYIDKIRKIKKASSISINKNTDLDRKIKKGGVYLITGGVGGLGSVFARNIAKIEGTQLILTGRRAINKTIQEYIDNQPKAQYYTCDVTKYEEVKNMLQNVLANYGKIDGIIHCAGIGLANTITEKTIEEVHSVLSPKILGVKNLDKATQHETIDFMMYCSSISSVLGDIGLSDYAAANAYMDHFAYKRNQLVKEGKRTGTTLSINWGLWKSDGMQANEESIEFLSKQWGMYPLSKKEGELAFEKTLLLKNEQTIVVYGEKKKLDVTFNIKTKQETALIKESTLRDSSNDLKAVAYKEIVEIFKKELKLKEEQILPELPFEEYGIDSMLVVKLTNRLGDVFEGVSVSVLFEYQTIDELVSYFVKQYPETLQALKISDTPSKEIAQNHNVEETDKIIFPRAEAKNYKRLMQSQPVLNTKKEEGKTEDVAIIGISGMYPGADDIDQFWENLKAGKDSITEIPEERWSVNDFYNDQKGKKGTSYSKWGGFINDIDKFDPLFFNISPREASMMDPQERLFLQTAWHTIEDAGYTKKKLQNIGKSSSDLGGNVGVFVGVMYEEYQLFGIEERHKGNFIAPTGNASSIANRVSYFLNLHGPSMAVATMCSSSLIAIQMACENIHSGNCEAAIAGGVNLSMHPGKYLMLSDLHLVSEKGRCETFGEGGDGYVPSEGVGAIMLKPLSKAKEDGDRIYAVIKGGAINHGGKVNGYTVPNPNAQASVISKAMERAGISPDAYSYIEAHGTGTRLGDPIEISGLKKAFNGTPNQSCKIGSVKSNIGHSEAAAGISGITKVLLQLKHKQLVPSIHSKTLNRNIDFNNTPFIVQQQLEGWMTTNGRPRIAGVSSFGAGGTNVHLVIEEYENQIKAASNTNNPVIIPITARNAQRLREYVKNISEYIKKNLQTTNINDIAYTLQLGREEMETRVAFIVTNANQLLVKLQQYLENPSIGIIGEVDSVKLLRQTAYSSSVEQALIRKDYETIAGLWSQGEAIDWYRLWDKTPSVISLPNYPFAKEYCWFKPIKKREVEILKKEHPLIHQQLDKLNRSRFISKYHANDKFIEEHVLDTEKILPGVAYLEMAKIAGEQYSGEQVTQLKDVFWISSLQIKEDSKRVITELQTTNQDITYVIKEEGEDETVFSKGKIHTNKITQVEKISVENIVHRLSNTLYKEEYYQVFDTIGFHYGKSFQGIEYIKFSENEALSKININHIASGNYWIVQAMDIALQTCLGIYLNSNAGTLPLSIPFSVKEVNIYKELPSEFWSYVKVRTESEGNILKHFDIKLIDSKGEVILSFIDFVTLPLKDKEKEKTLLNKAKANAKLYSYEWKAKPLKDSSILNSNTNCEVILAGSTSEIAERLIDELEIQVTNVQCQNEEEFFNTIIDIVKQKIKAKSATNFLILFEEQEYLAYGFVSGILKSVSKETSLITGKTISVNRISVENIDLLCKIIKEEKNTEENEVQYHNKDREVKEISIYTQKGPTSNSISIKPKGIYIITGGAGGLGMIFAKYLNGFKETKLFLIGRRELSAQKRREIESLGNAKYIRCDVSDRYEMTQVIDEIHRTEGQINGIIHSAGVGTASQVIKKTQEEIHEVLEPKIEGTRILDEVTQNVHLDFIMYVSSISAVMGDIGLADYASANAYMDAYAGYRNKLKEEDKRFGHSISINWGLWKEGGLQINEESKKYLEQYWGMLPLPTNEGLKALSQILEEAPSQVMAVYEKEAKLLKNKEKQKIKIAQHQSCNNISKEASIKYFRELVAEELQIEPNRIGLQVPFESYGMDSIRIVKITNRLNEYFGDIPNTLFFERPTLNDLTDYFIENYSVRLIELLGDDQEPILRQELEKEDQKTEIEESKKEPYIQDDSNAIAIIGMSGKYSGSNSIEEFWENLKTGKDSITEVPKERWNVEQFFDIEKGKKGKTYSKWGGFLKDIDKFDPLFFNISPKEAELMDPQERLFLQTSWETIEDAGYNPQKMDRRVGVFVGVMYNEYAMFGIDAMHSKQFVTPKGINSSIANRVSYVMNFEGPSMAIDTMCSSSITAIHLACESIRKGESTTAIAGGVNLNLHPYKYLSLSSAGFVSSEGKCAAFGEGADGYVPGEGVGAVLLKPLSEAKKDNDQIYGIIKSTEINHGGRANGFHVPNPNAQAKVIKKAIEAANIEASSVQYIEAHGTGTSLGDPIEVAGLLQALNLDHKADCKIGSVKSNIGHCESAAGISGLTKILLQLKHRKIVPSIHSNVLNKRIQFDKKPLTVSQGITNWEVAPSEKRRAGLSSFGAGGSNAHMIIEEHQSQNKENPNIENPVLIILSAKNKERLKQKAEDLIEFLNKNENIDINNLAYTLQVGRVPMESRFSFEAASVIALKNRLFDYTQDQFLGYQETLKSYELDKKTFTGDRLYTDALQNKQFNVLAKLWIQGEYIEWEKLYDKNTRPKRISLPTYPFIKKRYWLPQISEKTLKKEKISKQIHPLFQN